MGTTLLSSFSSSSSFLPAFPPLALALTLLALVATTAWLSLFFPSVWRGRRAARSCIPGNEAGHLLSGDLNVPVIHSFLVVKGRVTAADMVQVLRGAGIPHTKFQRLKQCVSADYREHRPFDPCTDWPAYWFTDPAFAHEKHVRHLPDGMSQEGLTAYLASVVNTPPPFDKSPWEIVVVNEYEGKPDSTALVLRLHHVLGDGLSLLGLLEVMTEPLLGERAGREGGTGGGDGREAAAARRAHAGRGTQGGRQAAEGRDACWASTGLSRDGLGLARVPPPPSLCADAGGAAPEPPPALVPAAPGGEPLQAPALDGREGHWLAVEPH